ncbi:MAG TPA: hypothetical protein VD838_11845 [Anaeromyxobacteraceae bacterium]|nr:hypothetical protein [Anaeromyxobacteraceae bacterium]
MRLTPITRAVLAALLVFVATAVVWWLVGFQIGKGLLDELGDGGAWRSLYGFGDGGLGRVLFLSVLATLAILFAAVLPEGSRWPALAALALGAALVQGERDGALAGTILFVLAAAATAELEGRARLLTGLGLALAVAFAHALDAPFDTGAKVVALLLRGLLFYAPLLLGPHLLDEWVLGRVEAGGRQTDRG